MIEGEGTVQGREIKVSVVVGEIRGELVITVQLSEAAGRRGQAQVRGRLRDTEGGRGEGEILAWAQRGPLSLVEECRGLSLIGRE